MVRRNHLPKELPSGESWRRQGSGAGLAARLGSLGPRLLAGVRWQVLPSFRRLQHPLGVALFTWLALTLVLAPDFARPALQVERGQESPVEVKAPRTIENRFRTQMLQEEAVRNALRAAAQDPANYAVDPAAAILAGDQVRKALDLIRTRRAELWPPDGEGPPPDAVRARAVAREMRPVMAGQVGLNLDELVLSAALRIDAAGFEAVARWAPRLVEEVMASTRITVANIDEGKAAVAQRMASLSLQPEAGALIQRLAAAALAPNLVLDQARVEKLRQEAIRSVQPVVVAQHQIILRRGELVTDEHIQLLTDLGLLGRVRHPWMALAGTAGIAAAMVALFAAFLARFYPNVAASTRLCSLIAAVSVVVALVSRLLDVLPWSALTFLAPVALAGMLTAVLVDSAVALVQVATLALLAAVIFDFDGRHAVVTAVSGMVAVFNVQRLGQRADLARTGLVAGAAGFATLLVLGLLRSDPQTIISSWTGLANGLVSSVLAVGLLPFIEAAFGVVSSVRLMELSNPNQPLLRRLLLEAPGTYHHSLMVGNLAEAAAEAVGADPVLCRAGALYHDVGKVRRPYFFVENQFGDSNPHDRLAPSLSTLIIMSHVKDGVDLARQHRVPDAIVEFIRTHHGTDLVRYFYNKAVAQDGAERVAEHDFRYPGPKPRTKETAIVMLADSVEASVRALKSPTPGRVEGLVHKVIRDRLWDGQLDESMLTLQDLHAIASAFGKVLAGVYHGRVEYPTIEREVRARKA